MFINWFENNYCYNIEKYDYSENYNDDILSVNCEANNNLNFVPLNMSFTFPFSIIWHNKLENDNEMLAE